MFGWFRKSNAQSSADHSVPDGTQQPSKHQQELVRASDILALEKAQNWPLIISQCSLWASQQPANPLPYLSSGNALRMLGNAASAVVMYRKSIDLCKLPIESIPSEMLPIAQCWYGLGHAHYQLGNRTESEGAFLEAARLTPEAIDVWNDLGVVYLNLKPYDTGKAFDSFKKAIEIDPKNLNALKNIGLVYALCGMEAQMKFIHGELLLLDASKANDYLRLAQSKLKEVQSRRK